MERFMLICAGVNFGMAIANSLNPNMLSMTIMVNIATGILCLIPEKIVKLDKRK